MRVNVTVSPCTKDRYFVFKKLGRIHTESENEGWKGQQNLACPPSPLLILQNRK